MPYKDKVVRAAKQRARYANDPAYKARCNAAVKRNYSRARNYANHIKHRYGVTIEQVEVLRTSQGNSCAICKAPEPTDRYLHIDHNHDTGKIRGLLCYGCNFRSF
jgi:hypothetical protein